MRYFFYCSLLILSTAAGCNPPEPREEAAPVEVEVLQISPEDVAEDFESGGLLEAENTALVTAEINGTILEQKFRDGDRVSSGTVLLRFDPEPFALKLDAAVASLTKAEVNYRNSREEYERRKKLAQEGFLATEEVDQARQRFQSAAADVEVARANQRQAERDVKKIEVRSPLPGIIVSRYREVGEQVPPGTPLFKVADTENLLIRTGLSEDQILHVRTGESVTIHLAPFGEKTFEGTLERIGLPASKRGGTFPVEVRLPNKDQLLKPGMVARVHFTGKHLRGILRIPLYAVVNKLGRKLVYRIQEGKALETPVQLGANFGFSVAVTRGLSDGDQVVVIGQDKLVNGAVVAIRRVRQEIDR